MRRAVLVLLCVMSFGCGGMVGGQCGVRDPVVMVVDSNHFNDVVIRDSEGRRLGLAAGLTVTAFSFCVVEGTTAVFGLDPVGESEPFVLDAGGALLGPGDVVHLTLGSALRISFASVSPAPR